MNKTRHILVVMALFFCTVVLSQERRGDRVRALRVSYINKSVGITDAEAGKFWPLYDEYHEKLRQQRRQAHQAYNKYTEEADEATMKEIVQTEQQCRQAELDIHTIYSEKLRTVIGLRKYLRLREAEESFRRELLKTIRERGEQDD